MRILNSAWKASLALGILCGLAGPCLAKDACALLTQQEAAELIGAPIATVTPQSNDRGGTSCVYSAAKGVGISIVLHDRAKARELKRCQETGQGSVQVSGSPEPGCMMINGPVVSISAAKGDTVATVAVSTQKTNDLKALAKQATEKVLTRL